MKLPIHRFAVASLALLSTAAMAYEPAYGNAYPADAPRLLLSAALSFGGDDLATAEYEHGGGQEDLEAGGGVYLGGGFEFPLAAGDMALRTTVGYQFDSLNASNGEANFDRIPWEVMVMLGPVPYRLGIGLAYHTDVRYEYEDDYGVDIDAEFDDATGLVIAYEIELAPSFSLALRYTDIEYEEVPENTGVRGKVIDGSNFGIAANLIF